MFEALKNLLDGIAPRQAGTPTQAVPTAHRAAAVLLMEVMRAADSVSDAERTEAALTLRDQFGLPDAEIAPLLSHAERDSETAHDYFRFTRVLNEQLAQPQKIAFVEALWRAAYADLHLDARENAVIGHVAQLLHVTQGEYIAAKLRAKSSG